MPTAQKIERVAALRASIGGSSAMLLVEYRGLTVSEISELRRSLSESETTLAVVKNTLMELAVTEAGRDELRALLSGPSAVAFVSGDPVAAAKKISSAAKRFPSLLVKGGWMDGRMLSADEAKALAELESREVMLSKIAGMLKAEMSRAASMFQVIQSKFVSLLEAYKEKLPGEEPAASDEGGPPTSASAAPTDGDPGPGHEPNQGESEEVQPEQEEQDKPDETEGE
jgi:large subunit ribosomal protein L10